MNNAELINKLRHDTNLLNEPISPTNIPDDIFNSGISIEELIIRWTIAEIIENSSQE